MKEEIVNICGIDVTLCFDLIDIPNNISKNTKVVCYFNFKKPNSLFTGELIRSNDRVVLFENEMEAKDFALSYIQKRLSQI